MQTRPQAPRDRFGITQICRTPALMTQADYRCYEKIAPKSNRDEMLGSNANWNRTVSIEALAVRIPPAAMPDVDSGALPAGVSRATLLKALSN